MMGSRTPSGGAPALEQGARGSLGGCWGRPPRRRRLTYGREEPPDVAHRRNGANREGAVPAPRRGGHGRARAAHGGWGVQGDFVRIVPLVRRAAFDVAFAEFVWWLKVTLYTCSSRGRGRCLHAGLRRCGAQSRGSGRDLLGTASCWSSALTYGGCSSSWRVSVRGQ